MRVLLLFCCLLGCSNYGMLNAADEQVVWLVDHSGGVGRPSVYRCFPQPRPQPPICARADWLKQE
mgnify:CR=1 FL=1